MYAVVRAGGKQHRVREGDLVQVEKVEGDIGAKVTLGPVLLVGGDGALRVGHPNVEGATVEAEIVRQDKDRKILVFKMKRRKNYHRRYGHRQPFTQLRVTKIAVP
jgi:large subunit ribosomal protein L21